MKSDNETNELKINFFYYNTPICLLNVTIKKFLIFVNLVNNCVLYCVIWSIKTTCNCAMSFTLVSSTYNILIEIDNLIKITICNIIN